MYDTEQKNEKSTLVKSNYLKYKLYRYSYNIKIKTNFISFM